jgi:hypothetical protein
MSLRPTEILLPRHSPEVLGGPSAAKIRPATALPEDSEFRRLRNPDEKALQARAHPGKNR